MRRPAAANEGFKLAGFSRFNAVGDSLTTYPTAMPRSIACSPARTFGTPLHGDSGQLRRSPLGAAKINNGSEKGVKTGGG